MANSTPSILDVYPAPSAQGIPLGDRVWVMFDQEMDETTINTGTFVLVGPSTNFVFGPDFEPEDSEGAIDEQLFNSPYFDGYVEGVISFEHLDVSGGTTEITDYTGDGTLFKTKAIFTPSKPLAPGVVYRVILAGDEVTDDDYKPGIKTRTVFDTELLSVSGSGRLTFGGGYTGTITRGYTLEITSGGATGTAEYLWYDDNDPLNVSYGVTTTGRREIEDGIWLECDPDGAFTTGDTFHVVVMPNYTLAANYEWSFTTGSGAIVTPTSSSSATGIDALVEDGEGDLQVVSVTPKNMTANITTSEFTEIVIKFNKALDASTITDETVQLWAEAVNGDSDAFTAAGTLTKVLSVDGDTLTIQI